MKRRKIKPSDLKRGTLVDDVVYGLIVVLSVECSRRYINQECVIKGYFLDYTEKFHTTYRDEDEIAEDFKILSDK